VTVIFYKKRALQARCKFSEAPDGERAEMEKVNKERERLFFNQVTEFKGRKLASKFYAAVESSRRYCEEFLISNCHNKRVLEYGCGTGSYSLLLAEHGAEVVGIDISDTRIEVARARAEERGLKNVTFLVMDAEMMQFEDDSFDMICGGGILHHLDINKALRELTRVLKPEGKAIFIEPMGHNPLINLFRKLTPRSRTEDEHPLTAGDLELIRRFFRQVNYRFFHLSSLLAVPFQGTGVFPSLLKTLDGFDERLFERVPSLELLAWQVVLILERPRKFTSAAHR